MSALPRRGQHSPCVVNLIHGAEGDVRRAQWCHPAPKMGIFPEEPPKSATDSGEESRWGVREGSGHHRARSIEARPVVRAALATPPVPAVARSRRNAPIAREDHDPRAAPLRAGLVCMVPETLLGPHDPLDRDCRPDAGRIVGSGNGAVADRISRERPGRGRSPAPPCPGRLRDRSVHANPRPSRRVRALLRGPVRTSKIVSAARGALRFSAQNAR